MGLTTNDLALIASAFLVAASAAALCVALVVPICRWGWSWRAQLPLWFSLCWPWLRSLASCLPAPSRWLARRLVLAGLSHCLDARDWWASQIIAALLAALTATVFFGLSAWSFAAAALAVLLHESWLRDRILRRQRAVLRDLPALLDLLSMSIESGASLTSALRAVVPRLPLGPLRSALEQLLIELRTGLPLAVALGRLQDELQCDELRPVASLLVQSAHSGGNIAAQLRHQAQQRQEERFARAEKLAMQAPVKMLAPLLLCIFPCSFLVLAAPIAVRLLASE